MALHPLNFTWFAIWKHTRCFRVHSSFWLLCELHISLRTCSLAFWPSTTGGCNNDPVVYGFHSCCAFRRMLRLIERPFRLGSKLCVLGTYVHIMGNNDFASLGCTFRSDLTLPIWACCIKPAEHSRSAPRSFLTLFRVQGMVPSEELREMRRTPLLNPVLASSTALLWH